MYVQNESVDKRTAFTIALVSAAFLVLYIVTLLYGSLFVRNTVKLSIYSTDVPVWAVVIVAVLFSGLLAARFRRVVNQPEAIVIVVFGFLCYMSYNMLSGVCYIFNGYTAFAGHTKIEARTFRIDNVQIRRGRSTASYEGYINNHGYAATLFINRALYGFITAHGVKPCVTLRVQMKGKDERALRDPTVLGLSDVFSC